MMHVAEFMFITIQKGAQSGRVSIPSNHDEMNVR
jgi:hypothetical protein